MCVCVVERGRGTGSRNGVECQGLELRVEVESRGTGLRVGVEGRGRGRESRDSECVSELESKYKRVRARELI